MKILCTLIYVVYWFALVATVNSQINIPRNNFASSLEQASSSVKDVVKPNSSEISGNMSTDADTLIVGGVQALRNEFPWLVNLRIDGMFCGGSLIALDTVLTAAHCMVTPKGTVVDPSKIEAIAGDHHLMQNDGTEQSAIATRIRVHESYNPNLIINDIALIKLQRSFISTVAVKPIALPQSNANLTGSSTNGTVAGWGTTSENGEISYPLMKVVVPLVTNQYCKMTNSNGQFCAGTYGKDSCQGDSGGPFLCNSNSTLVCGIVSYGEGCGQLNKPGVYTKVSSYISWIGENIKFPPGTGYQPPSPSSSHTSYPLSFSLLFLIIATIYGVSSFHF